MDIDCKQNKPIFLHKLDVTNKINSVYCNESVDSFQGKIILMAYYFCSPFVIHSAQKSKRLPFVDVALKKVLKDIEV